MTTAAAVARSAAALLAFLTSVLFAAPVRGELPAAKDPDAYTWHTYAKARLEWNRQMMVGAYEKVGKRDATPSPSSSGRTTGHRR